jgi:hypothetical protein
VAAVRVVHIVLRSRDEDLRRRGWIVIHARAADLADSSRLFAELRAAFARRGYTWW